LPRLSPRLVAFVVTSLTATLRIFTPVMIKGHPAHPTRLLAKVALLPGADLQITSATLSTNGLDVVRAFSLLPGVRRARRSTAGIEHLGCGWRRTATAHLDAAARTANSRNASTRCGARAYLSTSSPTISSMRMRCRVILHSTTARFGDSKNYGQNGGTAGVDVKAAKAWDLSTGSTDVIVAVIDTGVRYTHVELASQMWRNPGEIPGNGIDDDHNGYIDDVFGNQRCHRLR